MGVCCGRGAITKLPAPRWANTCPLTVKIIAITVSRRMKLFCFGMRRQAEIDSTIVILLGRGIKVEIRQQHLARMSRCHVVKHVADDRIVLYSDVMSIFEN